MVNSVELALVLSLFATILGALGFSLAFKDYIASFMAGLIFKRVKQIKPETRLKIQMSPIVKGDVLKIGWLRTTLMEVGDGERLPSVQTGRLIKIPNFLLFNNPTLLYGETIIDEVVAYVKDNLSCPIRNLLDNMKKAIEMEGHKVIEVGIYQKENTFIVHGIYESKTRELADLRSKILTRYLEMT